MKVIKNSFMDKRKFSERLKTLRADKRVSLNDLAVFLGIAKQSVHSWESMKTVPSFVNLATLASYFDVPTDYLLGKTDDDMKTRSSDIFHHKEIFSRRLAILRQQMGITLQTLGDALGGMTPQAIHNLEKRRFSPRFEVLCSIAKFFNVSFDFLLTGEALPNSAHRSVKDWREDLDQHIAAVMFHTKKMAEIMKTHRKENVKCA